MSYATVTELKAFLADPARGVNASGGMMTAAGVAVVAVRWADADMQIHLDAVSALIDAQVKPYVAAVSVTSYTAKQICLYLAAAALLNSELPEVLEGEGRTRAGQMEKFGWKLLDRAKKRPESLGTPGSPVYRV